MTVFGIALVIGIFTAMSAIGETMVKSFQLTGEPEAVVITQAGAMTVDFSNVRRESSGYIQTLDGVVVQGSTPLVSPELNLLGIVTAGGSVMDISLRGVTETAPQVHRQVSLLEGEWPQIGQRVVIGAAASSKLNVAVGDTVNFEGVEWTINGIISSNGCVYDQEIWAYLDDLAAATNRINYSSYTLLTPSAEHAAALVEQVNDERRFPVTVYTAPDYYAKTGTMARIMATMGNFIAVVIALGAVFGGMNALYSSVSSRRKELGILRSLGYRKGSILWAFLAESLVISVCAGILGFLLGSLLLFVPVDIPYAESLSHSVGMNQLTGAVILTILIGILGGFLPALRAARLKIIEALK